MPAGHPLCTHGKSQGYGWEQPFRHKGDNHSQGKNEAFRQGDMCQKEGKKEK
ncbi:hypothetical protein SDC9_100584 [bioreactor metagenome]|uniref:Uncharacterized protein n=1 Tax=bioreactor metagenome TaxID=1076179 RepID=A0A645AKR4_9ZZZZ